MSSHTSAAATREILEEYSSPLPADIESNISKYIKLLEVWGSKMPLTSIRKPEEVVRFHFGESLFALSTVAVNQGRLADVGTGAGFPGLAIKLARPGLDIDLIEPNRKKSAFLNEVVRELGLKAVKVVTSSFQTSGIADGSLSFVTCRALGQHEDLLDWAGRKLGPSGTLILWLGRQDCAAIASNRHWLWNAPALIPGTQGRFILSGRPHG